MHRGYEDTESVQLYGNIFVWNIDWVGVRADYMSGYCDWYNIETGTYGKWRTHLGSSSAHIPVLGVSEELFTCKEFTKYDTRNMQWYLGDDIWMQKGRRWYGYEQSPYRYVRNPLGKGNILPIKMGYNAWNIISSETQQVLSLIGYRKASYFGTGVSETISFKDYIVDLTSDQEKRTVILNIYEKDKSGREYERGAQLTFEQFLIQHCWNS